MPYNNDFLILISQENFNPDTYLNCPPEGTSDEVFLAWKNSEPVQTFLQNCTDTKALYDAGEPLPDLGDGGGNTPCLIGCIFAYSICMAAAMTRYEKDACDLELYQCKQRCNSPVL